MGTKITKVTPLKAWLLKQPGDNPVCYRSPEDPRGYNPYHNRIYYWRRRHQKALCCSLGRYRQPALGLDTDHPHQWPVVTADLLSAACDPVTGLIRR